MKKWMKKSVPFAVAASLAFTVVPGAASADKPGNGNGKAKGWQKWEQKAKGKVKNEWKWQLKDVDSHWAKQDIFKMSSIGLVKGYEDFTYQPNKPVTQAEAVSLLVRILELEDSDRGYKAYRNYNLKNVPEWAKASVAKAIDKGLLEYNDKFQGNKPASRLFVTNMLVELTDADIDTIEADSLFRDIDDLSKREKAALAFATLTKLVGGYDDKTFKPNKPVTRAEMAVFLNRLINLNEDLGDYYNLTGKGTIESIDKGDSEITVKQRGKTNTYEVEDDAIIYVNGKESSFSQIEKGMSIEFTLNDDEEITFISAKSTVEKDEDYMYTGEITRINGNIVWVEVDLVKLPLIISNDVKITTTNGETGSLNDLEVNQEIFFDLESDGDVTAIAFDKTETDREINGLIRQLNDLEKFDLQITGDDDFEANFYFEKKSSNNMFVARVELEGDEDLDKVGRDALKYMVDLFKDHGISFDKDEVELEDLKEELINAYDIDDAEFDGYAIIDGKTYDLDTELVVDNEISDLIDELGDLQNIDAIFTGDNDTVVELYLNINSNHSYDAEVSIESKSTEFNLEGEPALRFIVELFEDEDIDLRSKDEDEVEKFVEDIIKKYDIDDAEVDGTIEIDDKTYDLDEF